MIEAVFRVRIQALDDETIDAIVTKIERSADEYDGDTLGNVRLFEQSREEVSIYRR